MQNICLSNWELFTKTITIFTFISESKEQRTKLTVWLEMIKTFFNTFFNIFFFGNYERVPIGFVQILNTFSFSLTIELS